MSVALHHECTRIPVTASASCGPLFLAAEGPFVRIYSAQSLTYLLSQRIFQAQAVHGISVISKSDCHVAIIVWGGSLVRVCKFDLLLDEENANIVPESWICSASVEAPDWILHLSPSPLFADDGNTVKVPVCAAVTAHNALLELRTTYTDKVPEISITELTFSTRSILYSAHLVWASRDQILIAAGTAFGEIIFWSWTNNLQAGSASRTHRVFLGHEGSVFGVRISREYESIMDGKSQRFLASCSDDRTIRIWDVSNISSNEEQSGSNEALGNERTHHTGFTNPSFDLSTSSDCLAIGWGHISRVWGVQFHDHVDKVSDVFLLSSGEDATMRTWCLSPNNNVTSKTEGALPYSLSQLDIAAYHSGKNIWASTIHSYLPQMQQMFSCGADSKITVCSMGTSLPLLGHAGCVLSENTIEDIILPSLGNLELDTTNQKMHSHKPSKVLGFFRSYAFVDDTSYLLTTNTGNVYLGLIKPRQSIDGTNVRSQTRLIGQSQDLNGYSVSTGVSSLGIAFVAGSRGHVYAYQRDNGLFTELHATGGKVGSIFAVAHHDEGRKGVVLFFTVTGRDAAQLLHLTWSESGILTVLRQVDVPIAVAGSGLTVTSMGYVASGSSENHLFLGFRQGSVAMYCTDVTIISEEATTPSISYIQTIAGVHGKETVTSLSWLSPESRSGYLISTGRDGHLVIHLFHPARNSLDLIHRLNLPVGSNIEGAHLIQGNLQVYGFSSKHFVLYDVTAEEELISVDTGGAHRSWAFQPDLQSYGCGTLVWTRASSMHICQQTHSSHEIVRRGGHGREIKAVAVTNPTNQYRFIATGAEDTDIKIFQYEEGNFIGGRTLRKHKTGIQHLQWSEDGSYLFSSGGCEEFYIWKVSTLPSELGTIGVVCESVYQPESEHADLRLMSFDVKPYDAGFCISMVFSDSNIKVYYYDPTSAKPWYAISTGTYFTSCLTQCFFLSSDVILTAGTDGHAVLWPAAVPPTGPWSLPADQPESQRETHPIKSLKWGQPTRIHQSSSKTMAATSHDKNTTLLASGGDDGSISFLLASASTRDAIDTSVINPPVTVVRTHASAVTACTIVIQDSRYFVVTSGNDQWLRLWEVILPDAQAKVLSDGEGTPNKSQPLDVKRICKLKTNVADVSSMVALGNHSEQGVTRILVCGVGMEVIRVEF